MRCRRREAWAWAWTAVLLVQPQIWWHYGIVLVGALGVGLSARERSRPADSWWLVAGALATAVLAMGTEQAVLMVVFNGFVVAVLAFLTVLGARSGGSAPRADVVDNPE